MGNDAFSSTRRYYHRKLFLSTFCIVVFGAVIGGLGIFALFPSSLGEGYGKALLTIQGMEQELLSKILWFYGAMALFFIPAIAFLLMFYSHRIAGPAFRLGREAGLIARGNLKADFQLRQKDNLTDIENNLKLVAARYRDSVITIKAQTESLEARSESLSGMVQQGKDQGLLGHALDEISSEVKTIGNILSEIRT